MRREKAVPMPTEADLAEMARGLDHAMMSAMELENRSLRAQVSILRGKFIGCKSPSDILVVDREAFEYLRTSGPVAGCDHPHQVILGDAYFSGPTGGAKP